MIDGRNLYDQAINDLIKHYNGVRKVWKRQGDNYMAGCLLGYAYFRDNYAIIAVYLSKQKSSDANPRSAQQIVFQGVVGGADNTKVGQ